MGSALVLVVEVVGVLPDIEGQNGLEAMHHGIICTRVLGNGERAGGIGMEPDPAGAKQANTLRFKLRFEGVDAPPTA